MQVKYSPIPLQPLKVAALQPRAFGPRGNRFHGRVPVAVDWKPNERVPLSRPIDLIELTSQRLE